MTLYVLTNNEYIISAQMMTDLGTVRGRTTVITTTQMISRMVLTMLIMMPFTMMVITEANVGASSGAVVTLAVTLLDAVRRRDSSLRVYFAQVILTNLVQNNYS